MKTTDSDKEHLGDLPPHLSKIEKMEVFSAPENYFENLGGKLQDRIYSNPKPKNYWVPDYKLLLVTSSICLLVLIGIKYMEHSKTNSTEIGEAEIMQNYESNYLISSDVSDLTEQLDDEALNSTSEQIDNTNGLSTEEIEDYLLINNIDLTTISNEF